MVSLASSVHAGPLMFAVLVGSGVSRSAGVPSGDEVTVDLIRHLADAHRKDAGADPIAWYREHVGGEPDYSTIVAELARSPADRSRILSSYFEPTPEERQEGLKVPTRAHHAIAHLVAGGFVRVIITTNFDRLLEKALSEAGVEPIVVSSPADAEAAMPIMHSRCTVIKVHGDYLFSDLRNTAAELAVYEEPIDRLLDEVFDQHGLVVCGWSAKSDVALRDAILRTRNRRFSTYWLHRGPPLPEAEKVIANRGAVCIEIRDADTAMEELCSMVEALADALDQRPVDTAVAVARLKRYLPDAEHRIRLHDLVIGETDAVIDQVRDLPMGTPPDPQGYVNRMVLYERAAAGLMQLLAVGAFFSDDDEHDRLWVRCIDRLAARSRQRSGNTALLEMQQYPTLLAIYALGVGAFAADRINPIAHVLAEVSVRQDSYSAPIAFAVNYGTVLGNTMGALHGFDPYTIRGLDHLLVLSRQVLSDIAPEPERQEDIFDQVTYLMGVAYAAHFGDVTPPATRMVRLPRGTDHSPRASVENFGQALVDAGLFASHEHLVTTGDAYCESLRQAFPGQFDWFVI